MIGAPPVLPPRPPAGLPPAGLPVRAAADMPAAGQRRRGSQPPAGAPSDRDHGPYGADRPDHLWSVLHHREEASHSPGRGNRAEPAQPGRPRSREKRGADRDSRSAPSRPDLPHPNPALQAPVPFQPYQQQLPPIGWAPASPPVGALADPDWRAEMKAGALRPRIVALDGGGQDTAWLERRLEAAQTEQRADISRRFSSFEQSDKHFKDWVQREHEQLHGQVQQAKIAAQEGSQQAQRLIGNLTAQNQKQDMRLQELESSLSQATAQVQGLMNAVSAGHYGSGGGHGAGTGEAAMGAAAIAASQSANLEVLRAGLEREASARVALSSETAEQLKQLNDMVQELNNRQQQQFAVAQQQLQHNAAQDQQDSQMHAAKFAALEPSVHHLREELEHFRDQLQRNGTDCARRCDEAEAVCQRQLSSVQEAALNAARELWEEHQGVVAECKASLASLQQILESKDKIAAQLRSLQQEQRDHDRQELLSQLQQKHEELRTKVLEAEHALAAEQNARVAEQQRADTVTSRLGVALEKAQAAWIKESSRFAADLLDAKRELGIEVEGEARGLDRRLHDGLDQAQRRLDDLERKVNAAKTELTSVGERVDANARAQGADLRDAESRLQRQFNDLSTLQASRVQQAVFDMQAELAKSQQMEASERNLLRQALEDAEAKLLLAVSSLDTRTTQRLADALDYERERTRQEQQRLIEEERSMRMHSDAERMASLQRRLKAHEDQVLRHLESLQAEAATLAEQLKQQVEASEKRQDEALQHSEARCAKRLEDELVVERKKVHEDIQAVMEEERSERLRAEAERLASLQKRLQAHEELTTQRLQELRGRLQDVMDTHRQAVEKQLLQDKQELQSELSDFSKEQRQGLSAISDEVSTVKSDCHFLAENMEAARQALDERLESELAAIAARLAVSAANQAASLQRAADAADEAFALQKEQVKEQIDKVSSDMDKMHAQTLTLIDDEVSRSLDRHTALEGRASTMEVAFSAKTRELEEKDKELEASIVEVGTLQQRVMDQMRENLTAETERLVERFGQVQDDVQAVEAEMLRRCQVMEETQADAQMSADTMFGNLQAQIGELGTKLEDSRSAEGALSQQITEVQDHLQALDKGAGEMDSRAGAIEELLGQETTRATSAEDLLKRTMEELAGQLAIQASEQKSLLAKGEEQGKRQQELVDESRKALEALVREEQDRAQEAEAVLREGQAAQASQVATLASSSAEERATLAEKAAQQGKEQEELRQQIAEQQKKLEETRTESMSALEAAKTEAMSAVEASKTDTIKALEDARAEASSAVEKAKEETMSAIEAVRGDAMSAVETAKTETIGALESDRKEALAAFEARMAEDEGGMNDLRKKLDELQAAQAAQSKAQEEAVQEEEERAKNSEELLKEQVEKLSTKVQEGITSLQQKGESQERVIKEIQDEAKLLQEHVATVQQQVDETKKQADKAGADASDALQQLAKVSETVKASAEGEKAADKELEKELEKLKSEQKEALARVEQQLQKTAEAEQKAAAEASARTDEEKKQREKEVEGQKEELQDLQKRMQAAEAADELLKKEAETLRQAQEKDRGDQAKINQQVQQRQDATTDDIMLVGQKLEELARQSDSSAAVEEVAAKLQHDMEGLQEHSKDMEEKISFVHVRMEGGFQAMLERLEAERWVAQSVDKVADSTNNAFLKLLDDATFQLNQRVEKLEKVASAA
eukprot:gb/GFBE01034172.1/.p1 GENE.gb/GFBE01034172.1/~~gb/GFBE01034172.1/.p1  ORF type:complete len:1704 (+),score=596.65 gb/GFBE01034172.1/:1-5112(+)